MKLCTAFLSVLVSSAAVVGAAQSGADAAAQPPAVQTTSPQTAGKYQNFALAIYIPVPVVRTFAEPGRLEKEWSRLTQQLKIDKVYIESQRDRMLASDELLAQVKAFFVSRGVRVAGGITFSDSADAEGQFRSFCYTDPNDREFVKRATELTARHFDEIILDDFFFVTTKRPSDIAAKGNRSWTEFRLELMHQAGRELVIDTARAVNPRAKVIIKYPNWYEHFAGLGFDLDRGPKLYDGIYTGTETRDPVSTDQFLQPYESYQILRYFENIAPNRNGGGWVDTYAIGYIDRYAEQLWDTLFAKARELTLFEWAGLLHPIRPGDRASWEAESTSFNYERMLAYRPDGASADKASATLARVAGYAVDQVDAVLGKLGTPIGIKSYRPAHAVGDDYLHNFIGMLGIPVDLHPAFPQDADVVLLTEAARFDPDIVEKMKQVLTAGRSVVVTDSLFRALQGKGIEQIVELAVTERRFLADGYSTGFGAGSRASLKNDATGAPPILFPQVRFLTNDSWALVSAMSDGTGFPLLLLNRYGKQGKFYVWTIPDNFRHLYRLPSAVISAVKDAVMEGFPVRLDGPAEVALFAYDNDTLVVRSYLGAATDVRIGTLGTKRRLRDLVSGELVEGVPPPKKAGPRDRSERRVKFDVRMEAHSFRAFALEP